MNNFIENIREINVSSYLNRLADKSILIYSPTSLKKINLNNKAMKVSTHSITKNIEKIDEFIRLNPNNIEEIVAFGGGTAIDIAKYLSTKSKKPMVCIPSMLSTNAYSTNKVALLVNNYKTTLDAKIPDQILMDQDLLKSSMEFNLYGLADILSIHTAIFDWELDNVNNSFSKDESVILMATNLLIETKDFIAENDIVDISNNIEKLYKIIGIAGHITNVYGNGKPESGSEHIFAKELESRREVPHGISVSIGIILMSILQGNNCGDISQYIQKINVLKDYKRYNIDESLLFDILKTLQPREDRYSIVNIYSREDKYLRKVLKDYYNIVVDFYVNN